MNYKIKNALKKSKMALIIALAIWLGLTILLSAPVGVSIKEATVNGVFDSSKFFEVAFSNFGKIGSNLSKIFLPSYSHYFWKVEGYVTIGVLIMLAVGIAKAMPKNEYSDIEHGSSDWASGEQYEVLSKKKGILLAENHYLPVDKRGNVNVLVVGRFWFW
ncbi:MAG: hypothetical protein U0M00_05935 [Clostridia bacterium]|jgi:hypothetical protein|nr:hypothetical protein [Clostridia bacterium]